MQVKDLIVTGDAKILGKLYTKNTNESNVFIATYNVTPFADIQAAWNAGKACFCRFENMGMMSFANILQDPDSDIYEITFSVIYGYNSVIATVNELNEWNTEEFWLQLAN